MHANLIAMQKSPLQVWGSLYDHCKGMHDARPQKERFSPCLHSPVSPCSTTRHQSQNMNASAYATACALSLSFPPQAKMTPARLFVKLRQPEPAFTVSHKGKGFNMSDPLYVPPFLKRLLVDGVFPLEVPVTCPLESLRLDYADNGPLAGVFDRLGID